MAVPLGIGASRATGGPEPRARGHGRDGEPLRCRLDVDYFTGFTNPPVYLAEYNTGGSRVQTISTIPAPPNDNGLQEATGTILSPDGKTIYVYNQSTDQQPYLAAYNVPGNSWTQQTTTN